jgi:hypothetical protein
MVNLIMKKYGLFLIIFVENKFKYFNFIKFSNNKLGILCFGAIGYSF